MRKGGALPEQLRRALEEWGGPLRHLQEARGRYTVARVELDKLRDELSSAAEEVARSCPEELLAHVAELARRAGLRPICVRAVVTRLHSGNRCIDIQVVVPDDDLLSPDFYRRSRSLIDKVYEGPLGPFLMDNAIWVLVVGDRQGADYVGKVYEPREEGSGREDEQR